MELVAKVAKSPTPINGDKRVYKIALYGRTGSGKTCLLAALGMPPSSKATTNFSVDWLTNTGQTGKDWLNKAIEALKNNRVPDYTPNSHEHLTFDFTFSHLGESYQVQMIDYAGELVAADASESENAQALSKKLEGMDALLILAPVHRPSEDNNPVVSEDLHDLRRSFASLGTKPDATMRKIPIALVYNKWDLLGKLEYDKPENEWKKLEDYLGLTLSNASTPNITVQPPPPVPIEYYMIS